jgi:hypothetical protein
MCNDGRGKKLISYLLFLQHKEGSCFVDVFLKISLLLCLCLFFGFVFVCTLFCLCDEDKRKEVSLLFSLVLLMEHKEGSLQKYCFVSSFVL